MSVGLVDGLSILWSVGKDVGDGKLENWKMALTARCKVAIRSFQR